MTKKKNQDSKTKLNNKENLANIVRSEMLGKEQVRGILKRGNNFCISGLIINHFAPDINIEGDSWGGITRLVDRYPKYFSEADYSSAYYNDGYVEKYVHDFKQYYKDTKRINLKLLARINDKSFDTMNPFTFEDFANLFQEIGIKIERLDSITAYKEDNVLSLDNVQLIEEDKPMPSIDPNTPLSNLFNSQPIINVQNMNVVLDPNVMNNIISNYVSQMLSKQTTMIERELIKPSKDIIKTEHKD